MRQVRGRGTYAAANGNVMVIDRCGFESNDRIMGRFQLWIVGLFAMQVINSTVGVEPDSFQENRHLENIICVRPSLGVSKRTAERNRCSAANLRFSRIGI